jgi:hypothetical protein
MGGGKERKMTGGLAAADHVSRERSSEKSEAKASQNRERYKTYFIKKALRPT